MYHAFTFHPIKYFILILPGGKKLTLRLSNLPNTLDMSGLRLTYVCLLTTLYYFSILKSQTFHEHSDFYNEEFMDMK